MIQERHSVAGIVFVDSLVLIGRRICVGQMGGRWEFPGGKVEPGETYSETLVREFDEEFSVPITVGQLIAEAVFENSDRKIILHAFQVFLPENDDISWVLTEHTEVKWVPFSQIRTLSFVDSDMLLLDQVEKFFTGKK